MSSSDPAKPEQPDLLDKLEHLQHWWREPVAGVIAVGVSTWDMWHFGSAGFTSSLDEILLLTGVALIAGVRNLFGSTPERKPPPPNA